MKKGEEVYFFDAKRLLRTGIVLRNSKGIYTIRDGKKIIKRRISQVGRKENGIRKDKTNKAGMER